MSLFGWVTIGLSSFDRSTSPAPIVDGRWHQ